MITKSSPLPAWNKTSLISSANPNQTKLDSDDSISSQKNTSCSRCGGNGYMKTTPNSYNTCLDCLGRGWIFISVSN